jgi:hypothetical protein
MVLQSHILTDLELIICIKDEKKKLFTGGSIEEFVVSHWSMIIRDLAGASLWLVRF